MPKLYDQYTDRNGRFTYAGETSADFGVIITEAPTRESPQRKAQALEVPGRNGVILQQQDAWDDVTRPYKVCLAVDHAADFADEINDFCAWLNSVKGYQRLEDNFEPDIFRLAYYNGGAEVSNNFMQYGEATVPFVCRAERFLKSGDTAVAVASGDSITNPTRFYAKPLIHIEGSGNISITIKGVTMTAQVTDYINIDCESMNAYRQVGESMNNKIAGTFPKLAPGANVVTLSGTITAATIKPRFFTV